MKGSKGLDVRAASLLAELELIDQATRPSIVFGTNFDSRGEEGQHVFRVSHVCSIGDGHDPDLGQAVDEELRLRRVAWPIALDEFEWGIG